MRAECRNMMRRKAGWMFKTRIDINDFKKCRLVGGGLSKFPKARKRPKFIWILLVSNDIIWHQYSLIIISDCFQELFSTIGKPLTGTRVAKNNCFAFRASCWFVHDLLWFPLKPPLTWWLWLIKAGRKVHINVTINFTICNSPTNSFAANRNFRAINKICQAVKE